jgi:hypothetical protein
VASSDLKGLGAKEGAPVTYNWTMPSLMPLLFPWLLVLLLLALKPNRTAQAWWIWVPVALGAGAGLALRFCADAGGNLASTDSLDTIGQFALAASFGIGAVWLLSPWLATKPWPLVFLGGLSLQAVFGAIALLATADEGDIPTTIGMTFVSGFFALGLTLAVTLAALLCRRRFTATRLTFWVLAWLLAGWGLLATPFCVVAQLAGGHGQGAAFALGASVIVGGSFLTLLPFLLLSFSNSFYQARFRAMLGIKTPSQPPPLPPPLTP